MTLNWGILGTGRIAGIFCRGVLTSRHGRIVAVGSRSVEKAEEFGGEFLPAGVRRHGTYDALLADKGVQAVYVSTPHPMHREWAMACMESGKHVLCEKPIGMNHGEAKAILDAAQRTGRFCMEGYMYRCHPMAAKVIELIREGRIGQVRAIEGSFGFNCGNVPESRLLKKALGGGGILDVGGYPVSFARMVAGAALGKAGPAEPVEVKGVGHLGATGVDEAAMALLSFEGGIVASVACGVQAGMENVARVFGSLGSITFTQWIHPDQGNVIVVNVGGKREEVACDGAYNVYGLEADVVAEAIAAGKQEAAFPAMSWADTLGNMKVLDAWREEIGLRYEGEKAVKDLR